MRIRIKGRYGYRQSRWRWWEGCLPCSVHSCHSRHSDGKADVLSVLKAAGFDSAQIESEIARHQKEYGDVLDRARREAQALGLRGTPGLIIGNQLVLGRAGYAAPERLVARARALSAGPRIADTSNHLFRIL